MRRTAEVISVMVFLLACTALGVGFTQGQQALVITGVILVVVALFILAVALVNSSQQTSAPVEPVAVGSSWQADKSSAAPSAVGDVVYIGAVRQIRNNGSMRGVDQFGTEIEVDVYREGAVLRGLVRQYLTPVQIACLINGAEVRLVPSTYTQGHYSLVLDRWEDISMARKRPEPPAQAGA